MGKAAISLSKLADTAREELPSTMAAVRLSAMEISDLTLELNDLSQEKADGVSKSTKAVQAAEAGILQIGTIARQQTVNDTGEGKTSVGRFIVYCLHAMECAMGKAAISLSKLADTAREELPRTMAAVRLSAMEISDLTLELNDLSQEKADGVSKSTKAVQAAEAGILQIGTIARQQTMSMIQERASLTIISLQPTVVGAAKKTSLVVGQATRNLDQYNF